MRTPARRGADIGAFAIGDRLAPYPGMTRMLHDRFLSYDEHHAWDLATGSSVMLRSLLPGHEPSDDPPGLCIDRGVAPDGSTFEAWDLRARPTDVTPTGLEAILDLLDHGCDGEPRWITVQPGDPDQAGALRHAIAREARRRGYVPVATDVFHRLRAWLEDALRDRAVVLMMGGGGRRRALPRTPDPLWLLVRAATLNPRPHVLVTIASGADRGSNRPLVVREARHAYGDVDAWPKTGVHLQSPECLKYLARAERAQDLARAGRHAAAVRTLRECAGALERRHNPVGTARVGLMLGRVLLERGHSEEAERAFTSAAVASEAVSETAGLAARVWVALARTDAGRLLEAEALLRALRLAGGCDESPTSRWRDAALARCLLWQGRGAEARPLVEVPIANVSGELPFETVATLATHVRILIECGTLFDAGQRARTAVNAADARRDPSLQVVAYTAHLRVLTAAGDFGLARECLDTVIRLATTIHSPLRRARAWVVWVEALRRAGRGSDANAYEQRLRRMARAAPPLLARHIDAATAPARATVPRGRAPGAPHRAEAPGITLPLLHLTQNAEGDEVALQAMLGHLATCVRAGRVEVQSAAAGAVATIVAAGGGIQPRIGSRTLEAELCVGPESVDGAWEVAVPIRLGSRVVAALTCRWPIGRTPPPEIVSMLEISAAIAAPRVEALLAGKAEMARAAGAMPQLVGVSDAVADVRRAVARAAAAPFSVLVEGESGVGKELIARAIHQLSPRRDRRFCDVNCAALPDDLVESELFGHARGSFTGAVAERRGLFEEAHGGTLFLDELPDLSLRAQAKLLRVIQQGELRRVGESFTRKVDVRLVTATNRPLGREVTEGRFRQDLLYRIDVIRVRVPPLRERPEDVPSLAQHFWAATAGRAGTHAVLSHGVISDLARYHWPGNVRELQNVMAALAVAAPARGMVRASLLPTAITGATAVTAARLADARRQFERRFVEGALARAAGSRTRTAAALGVTRQGLLKLMARLGLE